MIENGVIVNETEDRLNFNSKKDNQEDSLPLMLLILSKVTGDYQLKGGGEINLGSLNKPLKANITSHCHQTGRTLKVD